MLLSDPLQTNLGLNFKFRKNFAHVHWDGQYATVFMSLKANTFLAVSDPAP